MDELLGKIILDVNINSEKNEIVFLLSDGNKYSMKHIQDCCEDVVIDDINGSLDDLLNSPILKSECNSNEGSGDGIGESYTYSFYNMATIKGYVTIRWLGTSNGYYSEGVSLVHLGCFIDRVRDLKINKLI